MTVTDVLRPKASRKLPALDSGGIRGLVTIEVLAALEEVLRTKRGKDVPSRRRVRLRRRHKHRRDHREVRGAGNERRRDPRLLHRQRARDV